MITLKTKIAYTKNEEEELLVIKQLDGGLYKLRTIVTMLRIILYKMSMVGKYGRLNFFKLNKDVVS